MHTFCRVITGHLSASPDFPWLSIIANDRTESFSIKKIVERTYDYCSFYRSAGIEQNDTIVIILKESLDLFASFYAGIVYGALPAYYFYPSPKQTTDLFLKSVENLFQYNRVKAIVSYPEVIAVLKSHTPINSKESILYIDNSNVPSLRQAAVEEFEISTGEAFLQFSSGTTGAKKGVKISAEALFHQLDAYSEFIPFVEEDKIVSWLPHYHDMGLIACMLMPFIAKVPLFMLSPFEWVRNPRLLLDWITKVRGTHVWLPNFALAHLTRSIPETELGQIDLSSVKQLVCCSEPALQDTVQSFVQKFEPRGLNGKCIQNCYAMAENTFAMTSTKVGPIPFLTVDPKLFRERHEIQISSSGRSIASAGVPLSNVEIRVVSEKGLTMPPDHVGEILIRSNCMLECYHNNPEETQHSKVDGWFKTGDLGFFHNGELFITGRNKDMIIVGGENIYPQDIELILNSEEFLIPGRNVVFGVVDKRTGTERIVVLAEVEPEHLNADTILLRTKILNAVGVSVSQIVLLPHMTLLKGTAGKISRYLNRQAFLDGKFAKLAQDYVQSNQAAV